MFDVPVIRNAQGDLKIDARYNLPENLGKLSATLKRKADFIRATFSTTRRVVGTDIINS